MRTLSTLMSLTGRTALITGGAGHLGRAMGAALAELGADVALADVDRDGAVACADELAWSFGVRAAGLGIDLAVHEDVCALPRNVHTQFGRLDILVNNAGFVGGSDLPGWVTPFEEQTTETWRKALEVNLTAPFTLCRESVPLLQSGGQGVIINVGSIYGILGPDMRLYEGTQMGNPAAYGAGKGGLAQMTRWLATALAPSIRVNGIIPGGIWRNQPEAFVARYEDRTPMRRMGREEDFKGIVAYLASDLSAYVTGQNIAVDGGWSAW